MSLNTTPEAIDRLAALDPEKRRALLGRFTPEERQELIGALRGQSDAKVQPEEVYGLPGGKDLAPPEQPMSAIPGVDAAMKATVGAGKSIGDTIVKAARFASMSPMSPFGLARTMAEKALPTGSMEQQDEALRRVEGVLAPSNPTESTAKGLTDFATMLAPIPGLQGGGVARAALGAALPTAIKSGGDPTETAAAAALGGGFGLAGKAFAPFAKSAREVQGAKNIGVTLPASARTTSAVAQEFEALAGKGFGGQKIIDRARKAMDDLDEAAKLMESKAGTHADTGQAVASAIKSARGTLERETRNAFAGIDLTQYRTVPNSYYAELADTVDQLGQSIGPKSPLARRARLWMKRIEVKNPDGSISLREVDANQLNQTRIQLNNMVKSSFGQGGKSTGDVSRLRKLAATLEEEIDAALPPDVAAAREAAKAKHAELMNKINSTWAKRVDKLSKDSGGRWEKIAHEVSGADASTIEHMKTTLDPRTIDAIKATRLADIFRQARSQQTGLAGNKLKTLVENNAEQLKALMTADEFQRLQDIAETGAALSGSQRVISGSQTAFLGRMMGFGVAAITSPYYFVKAVLSDAGMNSFISSPVGQRWLTHGFPKLAKGIAGAGRVGAAGLTTELERQKEEEKLRKRLERQIAEPIGAH